MVAIVDTNPSIRSTLNYNEKKVEQQVARLIHAANYPKDVSRLGFSDKLNMLSHLAMLNPRTKRNAVHIKISFHPSEKEVLTDEKLVDIAEEYMKRIGFGAQPFLVYRHTDMAHPHIHIVTTNIKPDAKAIYMYNIGRDKSIPACNELEKIFGLVKAKGRGKVNFEMEPVVVERALYGKAETKRAISNVVKYVTKNYKFTSLPEFNAALKRFNVFADNGGRGSRTYERGGLVYRILDRHGKKVGIPIKASAISTQPTLENLRSKFQQNNVSRQEFKQRIINEIDLAFLDNNFSSIEGLKKALDEQQIEIVEWKNETGYTYGITYVDHQNKVVFNGSDLGRDYSAKTILEKCSVDIKPPHQATKEKKSPDYTPRQRPLGNARDAPGGKPPEFSLSEIIEATIDVLTAQTRGADYMPYELTDKKKKRKKKKRI